MKKYVVCGDCGRKLCKAEPGSVVELVCPKCNKPTRVGHAVGKDNKKMRVCKKCGAQFE